MRQRSAWLIAAFGATALAVATSCGDVPTLENGIAYISPIVLPAPAVAVGDSLRDSLGVAAPLRVIAYDRNDAELSGVVASFLPASLPIPVMVADDGTVTASDTVSTTQSVQVLARIGDRLQTPPATLLVVPQPDSIARTSPEITTTAALPALDTLRVVVTGLNVRHERVNVQGILVRYRITGVFGPSATTATTILTADGGIVVRPDSLFAVDTTDASGAAARTLVVAGSGVDSVVVFARARALNGARLTGDSVHFVLRVVPTPATP